MGSLPPRLLTGAAVASLVLAPVPLHACSKSPTVDVQSARTVTLITAATPDTVLAGAGGVEFTVAPGHFGPAGERPVFGQVAGVERVGGRGAALLPAGTTRVVFVPWDYGANCAPTPYMRTARWLETGARGLITAVLRDRAHWAGGLPTFDIHAPDQTPYPQRAMPRRFRGTPPPDSILGIEQLFALRELLPDVELLGRDPAAAVAPLFAWARANPELARRYPADEAIHTSRYALERAELNAIVPPLAGTYRFTARLNGGPAQTFYARTRARATGTWNEHLRPRVSRDPTIPTPVVGLSLLADGAETLESLPTAFVPAGSSRRQAYMAMLREPEVMPDGRRLWKGSIETALVARQFPADSAMQRFNRDAFEVLYSQRPRDQPFPEHALARFIRSPDGAVRVEQTVDLGGGRVLVLHGERISGVSIDKPR